MAKGKRKRRRPGHAAAPVVSEEAILADLAANAREITQSDAAASGPLWGAVHKLLLKTSADPAEAARIITTRDADALTRLVGVLRGDEPAAAEPLPEDEAGDDEPGPRRDVPPETLKKALRAFRKRIKLTRLDHESRLGVGPMTGGRKADFDAILPPMEFPAEVWEALVAEGRLHAAGQGFYMLVDASD